MAQEGNWGGWERMGEPVHIGVGTLLAPCGLFLPAPCPDPFAGTREDSATQLWDQNPVCSFCGWVPTATRPLGWVLCEAVSPTTKQLAAKTAVLGVCICIVLAGSGISFSSEF